MRKWLVFFTLFFTILSVITYYFFKTKKSNLDKEMYVDVINKNNEISFERFDELKSRTNYRYVYS